MVDAKPGEQHSGSAKHKKWNCLIKMRCYDKIETDGRVAPDAVAISRLYLERVPPVTEGCIIGHAFVGHFPPVVVGAVEFEAKNYVAGVGQRIGRVMDPQY